MKMPHTGRKIEQSGVLESKQSGIRVNAHTMRILSQQYSDFEWAIVREYGTNMLDGYVRELKNLGKLPQDMDAFPRDLNKLVLDAGLQFPIIHLPSKLEPWIEFRD